MFYTVSVKEADLAAAHHRLKRMPLCHMRTTTRKGTCWHHERLRHETAGNEALRLRTLWGAKPLPQRTGDTSQLMCRWCRSTSHFQSSVPTNWKNMLHQCATVRDNKRELVEAVLSIRSAPRPRQLVSSCHELVARRKPAGNDICL
jgi:hypothetical protein